MVVAEPGATALLEVSGGQLEPGLPAGDEQQAGRTAADQAGIGTLVLVDIGLQ